MNYIKLALDNAERILRIFKSNEHNLDTIQAMTAEIVQAFRFGNKVIICGNGGSATDAMHFAEEFTGKFRNERIALPVISLSDPSHITCVGNDYGFDKIFSRGVEAFGKKEDIFIGLSTSGNSKNIINAVDIAEERGLKILLFLGKDGGKLADRGDLRFIIPEKTSDRIQEIHMMILHIIIEMVEREMFPENY
jgi:D-sedoheptulose 7-phosphate isomerase